MSPPLPDRALTTSSTIAPLAAPKSPGEPGPPTSLVPNEPDASLTADSGPKDTAIRSAPSPVTNTIALAGSQNGSQNGHPAAEQQPAANAHAGAAPVVRRPQAWSWPRVLGFRFVLLYVVLHVLPFPLSLVQRLHVPESWKAELGPWLGWYSQKLQAAVRWFGETVLGTGPVVVQPTGSGDALHNYVLAALFATLALTLALAWSIATRRLPARRAWLRPLLGGGAVDHGLHAMLRVLLRFYLGAMLLSYGFGKLFPNQMSFPGWSKLMAPYGYATPMNVLWSYIGSSPAYQTFTGAAEVLAGLLLLFRHTATLGALVGVAVMANVVMLNLCYDVPVKLSSLHYLAMLGFLLLPELGRLVHVFVLHRSVPAVALRASLRWRWPRWLLLVLKLALVGEIVYMHASRNHERWAGKTLTSPLLGAWEVTEIVRDGANAPLLLTDASLWRRVMIDRAGRQDGTEFLAASIQHMDESRFLRLEVDEQAGVLRTPTPPARPTSRPASSRPAAAASLPASRPASRPLPRLSFHNPTPDVLVREGTVDGVPWKATFRRVDPKTIPLLNQGFRWIQEMPENRTWPLPAQQRR